MEFFAFLRERGGAGVIAAAFPALILGSIVVAFHNVWSGPAGPDGGGLGARGHGVRLLRVPVVRPPRAAPPLPARAGSFVAAGVCSLLLAALLGCHLWVTA